MLVGGLHYADLTLWLNRFIGAAHPEEIAWPWALAAIAATLGAVQLVRGSMALPNTVLNGIAFVLLAFPVGQVAAHAWRSTYDLPQAEPIGVGTPEHTSASSGTPEPLSANELPDIYYFIFDRYASQGVLSQEYDLDNQEFIGWLKAKGFFVAASSNSNYLKTATSACLVLVHGLYEFS